MDATPVEEISIATIPVKIISLMTIFYCYNPLETVPSEWIEIETISIGRILIEKNAIQTSVNKTSKNEPDPIETTPDWLNCFCNNSDRINFNQSFQIDTIIIETSLIEPVRIESS